MVCDVVNGTLLKVQKIFRGKSAPFAKSKLEEANYWHKKEKCERALTSANLAVIRAPSLSSGPSLSQEDLYILPMSLFIRSEILFKLSEFELSLNDVQLALKYHLPDEYKSAAYLRMGECYLKLGNVNKSKISLNIACTGTDANVKDECQKILDEIEKHCKENTPVKNEDANEITNNISSETGISRSLKLYNDDSCGRYYKAKVPIAVGECIAFEDPYVSALLFEKHGSHCLHCYKRLKSPIPCPNCSGIAFCSPSCLNDGMKYHKWECPYLELAIGSGMSILSLLSWRIVTQQSLKYFKFPNNQSDIHKSVLNLLGHKEKRDAKDLLHRTLMALFILQLLRHTGYFKNKNNKETDEKLSSDDDRIVLNEEELMICILLLNYLQILQYNAHEIYETVIPINNINARGKTNYVALGLYLSSALLNHECQPALARYFSGKKMILKAQRPINVNELVSENYGPIFTMKTKKERQLVLKGRYLFDCNCIACERDWPKLENLHPETAYYRCKNISCSGILTESDLCGSCGTNKNLDDSKLLFSSFQEDWDRAVQLITGGKMQEAESFIIKYIEDMNKLVGQPSKNFNLAMEALRTIWANRNGNVSFVNLDNNKKFTK